MSVFDSEEKWKRFLQRCEAKMMHHHKWDHVKQVIFKTVNKSDGKIRMTSMCSARAAKRQKKKIAGWTTFGEPVRFTRSKPVITES